MATLIYLDNLSSGMRARIDPAYRLAKHNVMAEIIGISWGGGDSSRYRSSLRPVTRRKPLDGLKIKITEF
ncbi:MAG: hypothetical protein ACE5LA_07195 [Dehalococcoidales bacterium]